MRQEAEESYGIAEDALHGDPRAIRGRARIIEVEGRLDSSYAGYEKALAAVEARAAKRHEGNHLSLIHERIRTLRHKIVCLADMQKQALLPTLEAQRRADQIKGFLARSEIDHHVGLKFFTGQGEWLCIEWFASCVLHAKGWAEIGETVHAAKRLVTSLEARLRMIPKEGPLSIVELGNLRWWARAVREVQGSFDPVQQVPLAGFLEAVRCGAERPTIHERGLELLMAGRPIGL